MVEELRVQSSQMPEENPEPASPSDVIKIEHLNVSFGKQHVLKDLNLSIEDRKLTVIMGPSGCGKSTLIRTLNRMNDTVESFTVSGKVLFKGVDVYSKSVDPALLKLKIGMVFQKPNPFPISIYENVAFGPKIHKMYSNKPELDLIVETSLKRAALWDEVTDRLKENALKLSGGQQQRLCIARALAVRPEVILLDEPTSSLDPGSTSKIEELMVDLRRNYTVVLVTHDMRQAARVATRVAFLYRGELVESGIVSDIFENPKNKLTEEYIQGKLI